MKIIAVLLAGGVGSRFGADRPKQFLELNGRTILEYSVDAFHRNDNIDEIAIVSHASHIADVQELVNKNEWTKVKQILAGGKERYDSSLAAIRAYEDSEEVALLIHDSVRPLVSQRIIDDVCSALRNGANVVNLAVPTIDTIIEVQAGRMVAAPERSRLMRVQTPQAFRLSVIKEAYVRALSDPTFSATDDCGVVFAYMPEVTIEIIPGEERNTKLTHPSDLPLFEQALREG